MLARVSISISASAAPYPSFFSFCCQLREIAFGKRILRVPGTLKGCLGFAYACFCPGLLLGSMFSLYLSLFIFFFFFSCLGVAVDYFK